jgi:hypothetical protein
LKKARDGNQTAILTLPGRVKKVGSNKIREWYITSAGSVDCELRSFEKKNRGESGRPVAKAKDNEKQKWPISWAWACGHDETRIRVLLAFPLCFIQLRFFSSTLPLASSSASGTTA